MKDLLYWSILIFGGLCGAGWTYCLNMLQHAGGHRFVWGSGFCFLYMLSAACLAVALKEITVGIAYAVWFGIGATGTIIMGFFLYRSKNYSLTTKKSVEQLKEELDKAKKDIKEIENEFRNRVAEEDHD